MFAPLDSEHAHAFMAPKTAAFPSQVDFEVLPSADSRAIVHFTPAKHFVPPYNARLPLVLLLRQVAALHAKLLSVCREACEARADYTVFPEEWLFHHR